MYQCRLLVDNYKGICYTNSDICGRIQCVFKRDMRIRTVKIRLDCYEIINWNKLPAILFPGLANLECMKNFDCNEIYSAEEVIYTGSKRNRRLSTHSSVSYSFRIFLPKDLPSSYEDSFGKVIYKLRGTITPFIWNDAEDTIKITVRSDVELFRTAKSSQRIKVNRTETIINSFHYFTSGKINMELRLPKTDFILGETIDFKVIVKNESNHRVRNLIVKFSKLTRYQLSDLVDKAKEAKETLITFKKPGLAAHEEHTYDIKLEIPETLYLPNLSSCSLIITKFRIKIYCQTTCFVNNSSIKIFPQIGHFYAGMDTEDKSHFILPLDQPIVTLEVTSAFKGLTDKEKFYAHYISEAAWTGGLITFLQTSRESGPIFVLLHKIFSAQSPKEFQETAINAGFTEEEVKSFLIYTCGVFSNAGNYKGFGDSKFIPNIEVDRLETLLQISPAWSQIENLWNTLKVSIYDLSSGKTCLGYSPYGCSTYLSRNCTPEDNQCVQNWLKGNQLECYNTRLFKTEDSDGKIDYEIRLASAEKGEMKKEVVGNVTFRLTRGDYSPIIEQVAKSLTQASEYAANDIQKEMLLSYAKSFTTGLLADHKEGSRYWIQDKSPAVETYIGFIETYRDPAGVRGEFEGFVAIVNREMSAKFATLVSQAEQFLPLLPWPKGFEKDKFLRPDFTSLDVLTFASSGIPAGINIPNYDDIRQTEGFKNVSLGNVIPASYQMSVTPFLSKEDAELIQKYRVASFELQVGLHELLGHGSGKLLYHNKDETFNYASTLLDPLTGKPPATHYEQGDTYDSRFGPLSSSYEECRAEAVGLYLSLEPDVLKIFGHVGQEAEDVLYVNWLSLVWNGIGRALETWDPKRGWLQAHAQARFVLARVLIQAGVATVTQPSEGDLLVTLDRSSLKGAGKNAIGNFLLQLQVYKATANVEEAQKLYQHYSEVSEPWLSWRSIVLANKQPRKIFTQANTFVENGEVNLKTYEESPEGMIQSWIERFPNPEPLYQALLELSASDEHHFL